MFVFSSGGLHRRGNPAIGTGRGKGGDPAMAPPGGPRKAPHALGGGGDAQSRVWGTRRGEGGPSACSRGQGISSCGGALGGITMALQ